MKRALIVAFVAMAVVAGWAIGSQAAAPVAKRVTLGCNATNGRIDAVYVVRDSVGPTDIFVIEDGCAGLVNPPALQPTVVTRCDSITDNQLYLLKEGNTTVDLNAIPQGCAVI